MAFYVTEGENADARYDWFGAACMGDLDLLKELAEEKADGGDLGKVIAGFKNSKGQIVFHFAALAGRNHICKYLVEELKLNTDDFIDNRGLTPLHSAIVGDQYSVALYLLENGANPNATDIQGFTPLQMAAKFGSLKIVECLISKGAEIDAICDAGTALQLAASVNEIDVMKALLDNHANPNVTSGSLFSPMNSSIENESIESVKMLLKAGADPNFVSCGYTPLGLAASIGNTKIIDCLLEAGGDPNIPNHDGHIPIEVAASLGKRDTVMSLFSATSRILTIADWSVDGILKFAASKNGTKEMTETKEKNYLRLKSEGNEAFKRKDYHEAIKCYTEILSYPSPDDVSSIYSNRSMCWARLNHGDNALEDARSCLKLKPDWPKAYYRSGAAWMILKEYKNAADAFYDGWKLDLENKELENAFQQAIEAQREGST